MDLNKTDSRVSTVSAPPNTNYGYIVEKHNIKQHKKINNKLSFLIIMSIIILIVLAFFICYKVFIYMDINNIDIGMYPYSNNFSDGYDINYLTEQIYYKSLSDTDKDSYLLLNDFEKDTAVKKYLVGQIIV